MLQPASECITVLWIAMVCSGESGDSGEYEEPGGSEWPGGSGASGESK